MQAAATWCRRGLSDWERCKLVPFSMAYPAVQLDAQTLTCDLTTDRVLYGEATDVKDFYLFFPAPDLIIVCCARHEGHVGLVTGRFPICPLGGWIFAQPRSIYELSGFVSRLLARQFRQC
jgi:hypothetical protein